jgi:hypothetical protein
MSTRESCAICVTVLFWLQVLPKDNVYAVKVPNDHFTDTVRLVVGPAANLGSSIRDLSMKCIHVTNPLEQMDAAWLAIILHEVNG